MIVFPQLSSGAMAQFPFLRRTGFRTLVNRAADGAEIRVSDVDLEVRVWMLPSNDLSDQEWQDIENLFTQVEGRLRSFLFLEPGANLLSWSEALSETVWNKSTGFSMLEGQADPLGGAGAVRITSGGSVGSMRRST